MKTRSRLKAITVAITTALIVVSVVPEKPLMAQDGRQDRRTFEVDQRELIGPNLTESGMRRVIERYQADRGSLLRFYTVESSTVRRERLIRFYGGWLETLRQIDFDSLRQEEQIDYLLFRNQLEHEMRELGLRAAALAEITPLVPFADVITGLETSRRRMEKVDPARIAATLNALGKTIANIRRSIEAGLQPAAKVREGAAQAKPAQSVQAITVKRTEAVRAAALTSSLQRTLKAWFGFYNGYDPLFTWWVEEPFKVVDQALQGYAVFLNEKIVGVKADDKNAIVGDPIGREALLSELQYEMISYTPEELLAIAEKEFAWCETEMKKASRELGYGDDWKKALEYVKTLHVEPGRQTEVVRMLAEEALAFLDQHDLVTVPQLARDTWRMEMLSPQQQLVSPFFLGGEFIQVSYPTNTMSHEAKLMSMRGNNTHFSRATVQHELFPGHGLQQFMSARYRPYRSLFGTPFWTEGWALYWEFLLWDMKFPKTPEDRIGFLFWRSHRCARIIFSLGFHLEKMTPQECIDLLVNRVGHEPDNAAAEVRRSFAGNYGPLYQSAYMLGGLQFYSLHRELVDSGKMTNRDFHDAILKENRMPVEMVRAILTKQKLTRDFKPSWKFYGQGPFNR